MTDATFKNTLQQYEHYLEPDMFEVLMENADIFSEKTKKEIIKNLEEVDATSTVEKTR